MDIKHNKIDRKSRKIDVKCVKIDLNNEIQRRKPSKIGKN